MSQSDNSKDSQALLQSMLQRLKLQPAKDGQAYLHTPVPTTDASTWGQDGEGGASNLQKVNSSPVNGFQFGTNGVSSKDFGISSVESKFGLKGGEAQQPDNGSEVDKGLVSFPSQKDNTDGVYRVLGQPTQPGVTSAGTGQLLPEESLKDAVITSSESTGRAKGSFGSSTTTTHIQSNRDAAISVGQSLDQVQVESFKPKVYTWASKPTDVNLASQELEVFHMGNGGFGALAESKDMQIVSTRNQRSSETKTRRWTQKIKERWRDRQGSFGKKGKEVGRVVQKSEQGAEAISPENQLLMTENLTNTSNKDEERTLPSLGGSDPSNIPPTHTEDGTTEGFLRSSTDFEFGLGSFSLLDEIVTGQEWAKFLNPNHLSASANQRPSQLTIPPNPHDSAKSSVILNQHGDVNNQWSFRDTETSPDLDFSMAQISPDAFQPVRMDVIEGKPATVQDVHSETDQSEPMEHGHIRRPRPFVKPAEILDSSALRSRAQLSRKRQHQSAERLQTDKTSSGTEANGERSISPVSSVSNHMMEETGESQHENLVPLYTLKSPPPPLSPFTPFAPAPRGVLKHSISQDSQMSMETVTKKRRVEENRRVRFSEEVVTIPPPEVDMDATDSEDDSGAEEDSVLEECEEEQAVVEEVASPTRRPALPAWILALKRKNTGRKLR